MNKVKNDIKFERIVRPLIPMDFEVPDQTLVVVPGKAQTVQQLFEDYVLGKLDPSKLGGGSFDPEGSYEVDPFNTSGMTLEEADAMRQSNERTVREQNRRAETVANAPADRKQPEQEPESKPRTEP